MVKVYTNAKKYLTVKLNDVKHNIYILIDKFRYIERIKQKQYSHR